MATITIRNLDEGVKRRLRLSAAEHGRSMEAEAREILRAALSRDGDPSTVPASQRMRALFGDLLREPLDIPGRNEAPRAATFDA